MTRSSWRAQAVQYARMHPDSARDERSVHGSLSKGKKILTFFELTKAHTKGSGHAMLNTLQQPQHHSRSRMLHDASHRHTANHKIPKVRGEVCVDRPPHQQQCQESFLGACDAQIHSIIPPKCMAEYTAFNCNLIAFNSKLVIIPSIRFL